MKIGGVDYSLTSPAVCIHDGSQWSLDNCTFFCFHKKKIDDSAVNFTIHSERYPDYECQEDRYCRIAKRIGYYLHDCKHVAIESYAYGARKGQIVQLAENTGILKAYLYVHSSKLVMTTAVSTAVKKFAVGKGNASKSELNDAFVNETNIDLRAMCDQSAKQWNPSSDLIDAYYVCKYLYHSLRS